MQPQLLPPAAGCKHLLGSRHPASTDYQPPSSQAATHPRQAVVLLLLLLTEVRGLKQLLQQDDVGPCSRRRAHEPLRLPLQGGGGWGWAAASEPSSSGSSASRLKSPAQHQRTRLSSVSQLQAICVAATVTLRGAAAMSGAASGATIPLLLPSALGGAAVRGSRQVHGGLLVAVSGRGPGLLVAAFRWGAGRWVGWRPFGWVNPAGSEVRSSMRMALASPPCCAKGLSLTTLRFAWGLQRVA